MTQKDRVLYFLKEKGLLTPVWHLLFALRLDDTYGGKVNTIDKKHMEVSRKFFLEHEEDVQWIARHLGDQISKEIYFGMIQYRQTADMQAHPTFKFEDQYFVRGVVPRCDQEVFVDCGAFIGDTISEFLKWSHGEFKKIIALEPDKDNCERLIQFIKSKNIENRTEVIASGAWDREDTLKFTPRNEGSVIDPTGVESIHVQALDDIPACYEATYIKMDIEGAEQKALAGAKHILDANRPKLAICIYHSDEDMVEIPKNMMKEYPFYDYYVRQHSPWHQETVLYAIPKI